METVTQKDSTVWIPKPPNYQYIYTSTTFLYLEVASFGGLLNPSLPCLPTALISAPSSSLTPLPCVSGSLKPVEEASAIEISSCRSPAITLTVRASAEFQSEATGGSSGSGRLACLWAMRPALLCCPDILMLCLSACDGDMNWENRTYSTFVKNIRCSVRERNIR
jgi:hypothetical protein